MKATTTKLTASLATGMLLFGGCIADAGDESSADDLAPGVGDAEEALAAGPKVSAQGWMGVDSILDHCLNQIWPWNEFAECIFDLDTRTVTACAPALAGQVTMMAQQPSTGLVVEVDMDGWETMCVAAVADSVSNYAFHIGNDRTNDGWAGGALSQYDSEAHLYNNGLYVYRNDLGGSTLAASLSNAIPDGAFAAIVKDGYLGWLREDANAPNNVDLGLNLTDPNVFRVDPQLGADDSKLYVGFEHVVQPFSPRSGADLRSEVRILLAR
jgi:hypothetical protein